LAEGTRKLGLSTTAVQGGNTRRSPGSGVSSPLVQSVNYAQEAGTSEGLLYTRYGNTPNAMTVQKRLAMLEVVIGLPGVLDVAWRSHDALVQRRSA